MHRFSSLSASGVTSRRLIQGSLALLAVSALAGCSAPSPGGPSLPLDARVLSQPEAAETLVRLETAAPVAVTTPTIRAESPPTLEVVSDVVLAIHGGAGTIRRDAMTPELDAAYRAALADALLRGHRVLADGGRAADAVEAALHALEDSHLFNAGRGAVLTNEGTDEMDASIMLGRSGMAGAIAGAHAVRHPISAARAVMEKTEHVLLSGGGADRFVTEQGLSLIHI